ncbi:MAG: ATP-binding protein [Candidatus Bipolaricaulota bacterium]
MTAAQNLLVNASRANTLHHAYLAPVRRGTDLGGYGRSLARQILCPEEGKACRRKVSRGVHPDYVSLESPKQSITIDQIRDLQQKVFYAPVEAERKVFALLGANDLSLPAANSLLKTLESPPSFVHFLLLTEDPNSLPLTVLSRCQRLPTGGLERKDILNQLREAGYGEGETNYLYRVINGEASLLEDLLSSDQDLLELRAEVRPQCREMSPVELAQGVVEDRGWIQTHEYCRSLFSELIELDDFQTLKVAEALSGLSRRQLGFVLHKGALLYRDHLTGEDSIPGVRTADLSSWDAVIGLNTAWKGLQRNANKQLLLESSFLALQGGDKDAR